MRGERYLMEAGSAECKRRMRATRENFGETMAVGEGVPSEFLGGH